MVEDYQLYLLLRLFRQENPVKTTQIATIIGGKRTGSTLYQALANNLYPYFNTFPRLSRSDFDKLIRYFIAKGWLLDNGNHYAELSESGQDILDQYFKDHYLPQYLNNMRYGNVWRIFFQRLILIVQVLSQYGHNTSAYQPIIQNIETQYFIKRWIDEMNLNNQLIDRFANELEDVFSKLDEEQAQILAENFSGYRQIGKTSRDIRQERNLQKGEYHFYLMDAVQHLLTIIVKSNSQTPLLFDIWQRTDYETYNGLSRSTAESYYLLKQGQSFDQVAHYKRVKPNTILDQLIEMAVTLPEFPIDNFVSEKEKLEISTYLDTADNLRFKAFTDKYPDIPFYKYRLVQIQEIRVKS